MNGLTPILVNLLTYYKQYDQPLLAPIISSMFEGFDVDFEKYQKCLTENEKSEKAISQEFKKVFGVPYNRKFIDKKEVFATLQPETWELPTPYPCDGTGKPSTSSIVLKAFRLKYNIQDERINLIIEMRELISKSDKLKSSIKVDEKRGNKLLTNLKLAGARTGRISTSSPNLRLKALANSKA